MKISDKNKEKSISLCPTPVKRFLNSRWSGFLLAPIYGLFIYWWVTHMVLKGPPFTKIPGASRTCFNDPASSFPNTTTNGVGVTHSVSTTIETTPSSVTEKHAGQSSDSRSTTKDSFLNVNAGNGNFTRALDEYSSSYEQTYQPLITRRTR